MNTGGTPPALVFSDVDETLIRPKSMIDFLGHYFTRHGGTAGGRRAARIVADIDDLNRSGAPREEANRHYYRAWAGESCDKVHLEGRRWFLERSGTPDFFITATRRALARHRARGEPIVLVSGSFPAVLTPIAEAVGASELVCTRQESAGGRLTGEILGDPMIGQGKSAAVRALLERHPESDPQDCFGYGDHLSDLPMLSQVGHPIVVGGDSGLMLRLAAARALSTG